MALSKAQNTDCSLSDNLKQASCFVLVSVAHIFFIKTEVVLSKMQCAFNFRKRQGRFLKLSTVAMVSVSDE
jgi:hypothetical protein